MEFSEIVLKIFEFFTGKAKPDMDSFDVDLCDQIETLLGYMSEADCVRYMAKMYDWG